MRAGLFKGVQHGSRQRSVVLPAGQQIAQRGKARVVLCIFGFQHVFQHLVAQHAPLALVRQTEIGRQIECGSLFAYQRQAERVHGGDARLVHEQQLTAQTRVVRVIGQTGSNRVGQLAAHLGRCRVGVGHEQKAVDVNRVLRIGQTADDALDQHGGLARTGCRRHQQVTAPRRDGGQLVICPLGHGLFPPACPKLRCP